MSGEALDYAFASIDRISCLLSQKSKNIHHRAFVKHLHLVSDALCDIEKVLSGDLAEGQDITAIEKILSKQDILETALEEARKAHEELGRLIADQGGGND